MSNKSIEELEQECERLRELAHSAPFSPIHQDHKGNKTLANHTQAWSNASREWLKARDRLDKARKELK